MVYYGELGEKGKKVLGQNKLQMLQMVQFECPRVRNPFESLFTYEVKIMISLFFLCASRKSVAH